MAHAFASSLPFFFRSIKYLLGINEWGVGQRFWKSWSRRWANEEWRKRPPVWHWEMAMFACVSVCVQYLCGYMAWGIWEMSSWPLLLYWRCKWDVNQHDARCQGKVHLSRLANSSWLYALKLRRWGECEHVRVCLNLNETGPLKVSAEQAGTLSSAANGV